MAGSCRSTPRQTFSNKPNSRFVHSFLGESTFINVVIKDKKAYPKGDMSQALDLPVPPDAASDMVVATRPNAIRITGDQGFKTRVEKRIFLRIRQSTRIGG